MLDVRTRRYVVPLVAVVVLALAGCSSPNSEAVEITEADVVLAYVDDGVATEVADCFVGLAQREFAYEVLLPGAASADDQPLIDEMLLNCEDAVAFLDHEEPPPRQSFDTGPFNVGDDMYLDRLWTECDRGDGVACDELWEEAPVGSVYESFGVSCGGRDALLNCGEELVLDESDTDEPDTDESGT